MYAPTEMKYCIGVVLVLLVHAVLATDRGRLPSPTATTNTAAKHRPPTKISHGQPDLSTLHYAKSCPNLEAIISQKVNAWVKRDPTMAASVIRLHFHDCAVRGCDASVLLNHAGSERRAEASKTLRGFQVMDEIKAAVERACPQTVSCADILTAAARDATVAAGGPFWEVPMGRKDGRVSLAREADRVPQGRENVTALIDFFLARGLTVIDLVVLSGSHTIGRSTCHSIKRRLSNFNATHNSDPSIDSKFLNSLRKLCRLDSNRINLDATTPTKFDEVYYTNLEKKMGLLTTDQLLYSDARTEPIVAALASQSSLFTSQFAVSMVKLGNVQVLTGKSQGEIRVNCNHVN